MCSCAVTPIPEIHRRCPHFSLPARLPAHFPSQSRYFSPSSCQFNRHRAPSHLPGRVGIPAPPTICLPFPHPSLSLCLGCGSPESTAQAPVSSAPDPLHRRQRLPSIQVADLRNRRRRLLSVRRRIHSIDSIGSLPPSNPLLSIRRRIHSIDTSGSRPLSNALLDSSRVLRFASRY
jgi:hypothetical protein